MDKYIYNFDRNQKMKKMRSNRKRKHKLLVIHEKHNKEGRRKASRWDTYHRKHKTRPEQRWRVHQKAFLMEHLELSELFKPCHSLEE